MFKKYIKGFLLIFSLTSAFSHALQAADERKSASLPTVLWSHVFGFLAPYEFLANARLVCIEWQKTRANWQAFALPYKAKINDPQLINILEAACQLNGLHISCATNLSTEAFRQLRKQAHLRHLKLSNSSQLTDCDIELEHVETLRLASCEMIEGLKLSSLQNLKSIMLRCCKNFTDAGLKALSACPELETLNLGYCPKVSDEGLRNLSICRQLQQLKLAHCQSITNAGLAHLQALKCLQKLDIAVLPDVTDVGIRGIGSLLLKLEAFCLDDCPVGDEGVRHLSMCHQLQQLKLSHLKSITNAGLAHLQDLKCLQKLDIRYLPDVTDAGIASLPADNLKVLSITDMPRVVGTAISKFVNLESLALHSVDLSGERLGDIARLTKLRSLELPQDPRAVQGLERLRGCSQLQELRLEGFCVTDGVLLSLPEALEGLHTLHLSFCCNITERALETLLSANSLMRLEISHCHKIDAKKFNRYRR